MNHTMKELLLRVLRLIWICEANTEEVPHITDKLVYEPDADTILNMSIEEQTAFIRNAKMADGCNPDDTGNRARIRACYVLNDAYEGVKQQ